MTRRKRRIQKLDTGRGCPSRRGMTVTKHHPSGLLLLKDLNVSARLLTKPRAHVSRSLQRLSCENVLHWDHMHVSPLFAAKHLAEEASRYYRTSTSI